MSTKKSFWLGLPMQMMYGLVLGVVVGTMVSSEFGATYLQPLGQLFIRLIRMVVVPLVVATMYNVPAITALLSVFRTLQPVLQ